MSIGATSTTTHPSQSPSKKRKLKKCSQQGCERFARQEGYCVRHNGGKRCIHALCNKAAQGKTLYCISHGGGRRCSTPGCPKGAQKGGKCIRHGGGERCSWPNCKTAAQDRIEGSDGVSKTPRCARHGGARRCAFPDCMTTASPYSAPPFFCCKHGGSPMCPDCGTRKVARNSGKCLPCGGNVGKCTFLDCTRPATSRRKRLCVVHSGLSASQASTAPVNFQTQTDEQDSQDDHSDNSGSPSSSSNSSSSSSSSSSYSSSDW